MRTELLEMIKHGIKIGDVIHYAHENAEFYLLTARKWSWGTAFYLINLEILKSIVPFSIEVLDYRQVLLNSTPIKRHKLPNYINDIKINHQYDGKLFLSLYKVIIRINDNLYYLYSYTSEFRESCNKKDLESYAKNNLIVEIVGGLRETIASNLLHRLKQDEFIFSIEANTIKVLKAMVSHEQNC